MAGGPDNGNDVDWIEEEIHQKWQKQKDKKDGNNEGNPIVNCL